MDNVGDAGVVLQKISRGHIEHTSFRQAIHSKWTVWTGGKYENDNEGGCKCVGVALLCGCERHSTKEVFYLVTADASLPTGRRLPRAAARSEVTAHATPDGCDPQAEFG